MLLFAATLVAAVGSSLLFTVVPPLARELGWGETRSGLLISLSGFAFLLAAPVWGRWSDRHGRRPAVVVGLLGYAVAFAVFALVAGLGLGGALTGTALYVLLLLTRPVGGALAAAVPVGSQAWLADRTSAAGRASGLAVLQAANGLGLVVGPALGALLALLGLLAPLWVTAAVALALAGLVAWRLPDARAGGSGPTGGALAPWDRRVRSVLGVLLLVYCAVAVIASTTGFLVQDRLGVDGQRAAATTGACLLAVGVALLASQVVVRVRRLRPAVMVPVGTLLLVVGFAGLALPTGLPLLLVAFATLGFGSGLAGPGAVAAATTRVGAHEQGAVAGLTTATTAAGFAVGPLAGGALYEAVGGLLYGGAAAVLLALLPVAVLVTRQGRRG